MQLYRGMDTPQARGKFDYDARGMAGIMERNRALLADFGTWVDQEAMARSNQAYGLSPEWAQAIAFDISNKVTYSDLLAYIASNSDKKIDYLEIGVSVGKNFWQVLNHVSSGVLVGIDIEEINPPLRKKLTALPEWSHGRDGAAKIESFRFDERSNAVHYCTGNVFDRKMWSQLAGSKFNLVFSDALHDPDAITFEWEQISEFDLLDRTGFTMIWDDLVSPKMRRAFNEIAEDCSRRYGLTRQNACLMHVAGWVGEYEPPHPIGVISSQGFVH